MRPKIISGVCEFCGVKAFECQHYKGLVDESGSFLLGVDPTILNFKPSPLSGLKTEIYNDVFELPELPATEENKVDIVLIRFNLKEVEDKAIKLVEENTNFPYKLTIYDNYQKRYPLSDLWNALVKRSTCKYICLLNSDAFVTKDWLKNMMGAFNNPMTVAVGCSGDNVGGLQREINKPEIAERFVGKFRVMDLLSGFCMIIRKDVDIKFPSEVPFYGGEHAWCVEARRRGYKLLWAQGSFVRHLGEASGKNEGNVDSLRRSGQMDYIEWLSKSSPVLFTTYNRLDYTKKSLPALIASQTGKIFIFDNASTDGTQEYLREMEAKYPDRLVVRYSKENLKVAGAMNEFFKFTKGEEYVGKVDNDTIVSEFWFRDMLMMATARQIDIMQAKHAILNNTYETFEEWIDTLIKDERNDHIFYSHFVGGSGIVIKRDKIRENLPMTEWALGGWTYFQEQHPELRKAFCNNVQIELLDMVDDNEPNYSHYPDYYKEVKRSAIRSKNVERTFAEIVSRFGRRFAYTRFGDGELMMMEDLEGYEHTQYNSPQFKKELIESFKINHPDYLIGNIASMFKEEKAEQGFLHPFPNDERLRAITEKYYSDKTFFSPIVFHYLYACEPKMFSFFTKLMRKYRVAFIGGDHLKAVRSKFAIKDMIVIPQSQAYNSIDEYWPKIKVVAERNDIILISAAMTANVIQKRLWKSKINVGTIDFGSVASAMVKDPNDNHTWIKKLNR